MKCFEIISTGIGFSNDIEEIKLIKINRMTMIIMKLDDFIPEDVYLSVKDLDYPDPMLMVHSRVN